ncbi:MAG TPA: transcriptional repressor LexA, partial [Candidatus Goldiibacteriota bacterium]|nr:transcriptional repressor LexA [Candidatus Goldiibacteriota bacterium]
MITNKQKKIVDYINDYTTKHNFAPSLTEICKHCKMASVSTAHYHINKLYSAGILEKQNHKSRSLYINETEKLLTIPILGTISAGQPIEAIQNTETIAVPKSKIPDKCTVYALRVSGESMKDENINNGDIVLVKKQNFAVNGDKVIALLGGYEVTLKRYFKEKRAIRLQPANKDYSPIILKQSDYLTIQGVVIDLIKNFKVSEEIELMNPITKTAPAPSNKIILGDVIEELRKLPDNHFDIVIIDPPYNIGKNFGNNNDKMEMNDYVDWFKKWFRESMRVMKPTGTLFIYGFS